MYSFHVHQGLTFTLFYLESCMGVCYLLLWVMLPHTPLLFYQDYLGTIFHS